MYIFNLYYYKFFFIFLFFGFMLDKNTDNRYEFRQENPTISNLVQPPPDEQQSSTISKLVQQSDERQNPDNPYTTDSRRTGGTSYDSIRRTGDNQYTSID